MKKYKYVAIYHNPVTRSMEVRFYFSIIEAEHDPNFVYDELYIIEPIKLTKERGL